MHLFVIMSCLLSMSCAIPARQEAFVPFEFRAENDPASVFSPSFDNSQFVDESESSVLDTELQALNTDIMEGEAAPASTSVTVVSVSIALLGVILVVAATLIGIRIHKRKTENQYTSLAVTPRA